MNILNKLRGDKPPVMSKVKITRAVRVKLPDGSVIDGQPDQVVNLEKVEADALVGASAAERILNEAEQAEAERIGKLIPPPHDPRPMPEAWSKLPDCFGKWWALSERLRCLTGRRVEIEACVLRGHGLTEEETTWMRDDIENQGGEHGQRVRLIDKWLEAHPLRIKTPTDEQLADLRRLREALTRQGEAIDDFLEENRAELVELKMRCGVHVLQANGRLRKIAKELAEVGFQIFRTRISALGLEDWKVAELFGGSSDRIEFVHEIPKPQGLRFGWTDEDGTRNDYLDVSVTGLADMLPRYEADEKRLASLLKNAKAKLAKAQKATPEQLALPS